eukprot:gene10171-11255_t
MLSIKHVLALVFFCISVSVFFVGYHLGNRLKAETSATKCVVPVVRQGSDGVFAVRLESPPRQESHAEPVTVANCEPEPARDSLEPPLVGKEWVLTKTRSSVPEDVFPFLHHPASPARESFLFLEDAEWRGKEVLRSPCQEVFLTRTGSRGNQPNKCVALAKVPKGHESLNQQSYRVGYTARNTDQYQADYPRDYAKPRGAESQWLLPLLTHLQGLRDLFLEKMGSPVREDGQRRTATVMVANEGVLDLLLNFLCSAEAAAIDLRDVVVFVGDARHVPLIEDMGAQAIFSSALGSMPSQAADSYLDATFSRMMWCKATSVYLALYSGFNVLFQDVDLVWLASPLRFLLDLNFDLVFMDDGARTPRYTPFFVNSGFYFVRYNARTLYLFEGMIRGGPGEIGQTHSHQSVLIRHIAEAHHLFGVSVYVLDTSLFPSGQAYHENKPLIRKIQARTFRPYVFHMCWTDNRVNKVVYFKDVGLWYLPDKEVCQSGSSMLHFLQEQGGLGGRNGKRGQSLIRRHCCQRDRFWPLVEDESSLHEQLDKRQKL